MMEGWRDFHETSNFRISDENCDYQGTKKVQMVSNPCEDIRLKFYIESYVLVKLYWKKRIG